jgi:hypothetical protein
VHQTAGRVVRCSPVSLCLLAAACLLSSAAENPAALPTRTTSFSTPTSLAPSVAIVLQSSRLLVEESGELLYFPLHASPPRCPAASLPARVLLAGLATCVSRALSPIARLVWLGQPALASIKGHIPTTSASIPPPPHRSLRRSPSLALAAHLSPLPHRLSVLRLHHVLLLCLPFRVSTTPVLTRVCARCSLFLRLLPLSLSIQLDPH